MRTESKVDSIVLDWLREGLTEKLDQLLRALDDLSSGIGGNEHLFESLQAIKTIDAVLAVSDFHILRVLLKEQMAALILLESPSDRATALLTAVTEAAWLLRAVLDRLSIGAVVNAMSLLPMINRLRLAQGLSELDTRNILTRASILWSESRVFVRPYLGTLTQESGGVAASQPMLSQMEQQILLLMRGDIDAIPNLLSTFDAIIDREINRAVVIATRVFEELLHAVSADQVHYLPLAKRMIGRVLRLFRMEIQGRDQLLIRFEAIEFATDLLLELVESLPDEQVLCGESIQIWRQNLSTDQERIRFLGLETSALKQVAEVLVEELDAAQDVLDLFVRGAKSDLEPLLRIQPRLEHIVGVLGALRYDHESALIRDALNELILVVRGSELLNDDFLMKLAIAVMTTEQVVSQIGQHIVDTDVTLTTIDRAAKQAMVPLATACYDDIIAAKEIVNTALRPNGQPVSPEALGHAVELVTGVRNALTVAQFYAAMPLIDGLRGWLSANAGDVTQVTPEGLGALAEVSAAIEFYLENLRDHQKELLQFLSGAVEMLPILQRDEGVDWAHKPLVAPLAMEQAEPEAPQVIDESLASMDDLIAQLSASPEAPDADSWQVLPASAPLEPEPLEPEPLAFEFSIAAAPEKAEFSHEPPIKVPAWIELSPDAAEPRQQDVDLTHLLPEDQAVPADLLEAGQGFEQNLPQPGLFLEMPAAEPKPDPEFDPESEPALESELDAQLESPIAPVPTEELPFWAQMPPAVASEAPPSMDALAFESDSLDAWPPLLGDTAAPSSIEPLAITEHTADLELPNLDMLSTSELAEDALAASAPDLNDLDALLAQMGSSDQAISPERATTEEAVPYDALESEEPPVDALTLEMRAVFAEEMAEEVPAIMAAATQWQDRGDRDALMIVRRGFHTIKGSSRMVGLTAIGDWGWAFEHLLNHVLEDRIAGSHEVRVDVRAAVELMVQALPILAAGNQPPAAYWQASLAKAEAWSNVLAVGSAAAMSQAEEENEVILNSTQSRDEPLASSVAEDAAMDVITPVTWDAAETVMIDANPPEPVESLVTEAEAVPVPVLGSEPIILDPVLREIFDVESSGYIQALRHQVDHALINQVAMVCDKELARLVHTLLGSARTAGVKPIAIIAQRLEEWVRLLEEQNMLLDLADLAAFQRALLMMDRLRQWAIDPSFAPPEIGAIDAELVEHIDQTLARATLVEAEPAAINVDDYADFASLMGALAETPVDSQGEAQGAPAADQASDAWQNVASSRPAHVASDEPLFARPAAADFEIALRPDDIPAEQDADILQIFLEEAEELLEKADGYIAHWRSYPHDLDSIRLLHRNLHTLKGGARMAGLLNLADVTHLLEERLDRARDRGGEQTEHLIYLVQHTFDALAKMLELVRRQEPVPAQVALLAQIVDAELNNKPAPELAAKPSSFAPDGQATLPLHTGNAVSAESEPEPEPEAIASYGAGGATGEIRREQIRVDADRIDAMVNQVGESVLLQARVDRQVNGFERHLFELQQTLSRLRNQLRRLEIETESQMKAELMAETGLSADEFDPLEFDRFTQVQELSRGIMESLGDISSIEEAMGDLTEQSQLLLLQQSRLGRKMQDGMLALRMVRFNDVVGRLRRVVRQVGDEMGRNAELIIHNGETELDRVTLVGLMPSLEHMIRNSLAHGIESIEERRALGKPDIGQIEITIESFGGNVTLELKDDGRGLDLDTIRRKAIERKVVPADIELTDDEARALIFLPGFSTAGNVSQVAGRGVGMDVVASAVRELGGFVDLHSEQGHFTRIQLNLPLTQAMTRGILVALGDERFAIPYKGVVSVTRMTAVQLAEQYASAKPAVTLNGERYPLFYLGELLNQTPFNAETQEAGIRPVFLFKLGERRFAIQVDYQLGGIQLFVKSLGAQLGRIPGLSGATIADDGNVILVLELFELVRQFQRRDDRSIDLTQSPVVRRRPVVMVVDDSLTVRKVTARTLERNNLDVILARDGVEALGILHDQQPDVVLTDIEMPRMDGFELLGAIRNDPQTRSVPVIMISSRTGPKHRNRAEALGVSAYLGKPYAEADLIARIEEFLTDKRRQLAENNSQ
ncbi:MAG TPA: Hpt domain-containing protein [Halothiobacillus sp.]|nr:Hpt domain-containing protein [Halothiobacillus sp.]